MTAFPVGACHVNLCLRRWNSLSVRPVSLWLALSLPESLEKCNPAQVALGLDPLS
jgi:hypothetical protein